MSYSQSSVVAINLVSNSPRAITSVSYQNSLVSTVYAATRTMTSEVTSLASPFAGNSYLPIALVIVVVLVGILVFVVRKRKKQ